MIKLPIHSAMGASLSPDRQQMAIHTADSAVYVADTFFTSIPVNDPFGSRPQSGRSGASTARQSGTQRELVPSATCREVVRYHKGPVTGLVVLPDREVSYEGASPVQQLLMINKATVVMLDINVSNGPATEQAAYNLSHSCDLYRM